MVREMELRNIIAFLRVAESESFTRAAEQLGYVQSTVSIRIQQLEQEVGVPLFDRIGKRVTLTTNGQRFFEYANRIVEISEQAKLLGKRPDEISGGLRIGILESLIVWVLSDCIPSFHERFPKVSIKTKTASGNSLLKMLKRNELDVVFLLDRKVAERNCTRIFAAKENLVFVTRHDNPLAGRESIDLLDIVRRPLILTEGDSSYRLALEKIAAEQDAYISPLIEVDNTTAIVKLLRAGLGISFLPEYTVRDCVDRGELVLLDVKGFPLRFWNQVFYHSGKWVTPQMEAFTETIKGYFTRFRSS